MALVNCPECGGTVSDAAKKCPHCGVSLNKQVTDETVTPQIVHPRVANRKVESSVPPTNSNDYLYDEEESFFEKYKVIIITFLVLAIGVVGFFVYLHNKHKPSRNNEPETTVSDTAAVDSADVAVPVQDDSEEKSHSVIRSFFDKYWGNSNYQSLCQTHMTKHYAQNFLKNAKYNWRGEGVYCERCEDYEQVDPLHYEHPHQSPGYPDKVWIKSIDKYDTDKYIVTTEAQFMDSSPREYEIYRVTVTESDGKYLISCIERKDEAEHFYYDLAKMKPLKPITRNEDYEDTEEEY